MNSCKSQGQAYGFEMLPPMFRPWIKMPVMILGIELEWQVLSLFYGVWYNYSGAANASGSNLVQIFLEHFEV